MQPELTSLRCPQCGNPHNEINGAHAFGAEIHCRSCGTTSALIFNRQLHVKKAGERVCSTCGRVAMAGAEFCQCQRPLRRACLDCGKKFFVDDRICPHCCWNHDPQHGREEVMKALAQTLEQRLDELRYEECMPLERELMASIAAGAATTPEVEHVLRRLALGHHERGEGGGSLHRWSHLEGLEDFRKWKQQVDSLHEKRTALKKSITEARRAGATEKAADSPPAVSRPTGCLFMFVLFPVLYAFTESIPGIGAMMHTVAPLLVLLYVLHHNKLERYEKSCRLKNFLGELKEIESKREAWLHEFSVPMVLKSQFSTKAHAK